jgi:hypothetical protein
MEISKSQVTFIFFRGVGIPPASDCMVINGSYWLIIINGDLMVIYVMVIVW